MMKFRHPDTKAFTLRPESSKYETGYGRPPQEGCFRPGQSGNPCGRLKGAKNKAPALNGSRLKDIIMKEASRAISVRDGERNVTVPMAQAIIRSISVAAVKGNSRAQRLFTGLLDMSERGKAAQEYALLEAIIGYKVEWTRELERRASLGLEGAEPFPHPDQIIVDLRGDGGVTIKGPMTREEKKEVDEVINSVRQAKEYAKAMLEEAQGKLTRAHSAKSRKYLNDRILVVERVLNKAKLRLSDLEYPGQ